MLVIRALESEIYYHLLSLSAWLSVYLSVIQSVSLLAETWAWARELKDKQEEWVEFIAVVYSSRGGGGTVYVWTVEQSNKYFRGKSWTEESVWCKRKIVEWYARTAQNIHGNSNGLVIYRLDKGSVCCFGFIELTVAPRSSSPEYGDPKVYYSGSIGIHHRIRFDA